MATARNGDVELFYEIHGDGPPLLLIHGFAHGIWAWYAQLPQLSRDFTVIAFDNRGVGRSTVFTDPYTAHDMADDAVAVLDAAGISSAHVFGTSLGGIIAISLAARYPERVRTLVLASTHHGGPDRVPIPQDVVSLVLGSHDGLPDEERIRKVAPVSFRPGWPEEDPERWERIVGLRLGNQMDPQAYVAQAGAGSTDVSDLLEKVVAPTLVVAGTVDRFVPSGNADLVASRIAGARVELLEGAGHQLNVEEPDRLHDLIRAHCRETS